MCTSANPKEQRGTAVVLLRCGKWGRGCYTRGVPWGGRGVRNGGVFFDAWPITNTKTDREGWDSGPWAGAESKFRSLSGTGNPSASAKKGAY